VCVCVCACVRPVAIFAQDSEQTQNSSVRPLDGDFAETQTA
jgi:hypothetical protein